MSELTITLLRLGYLVLLWLFVLSAIGVLRRDIYGTRIVQRRLRVGPKSAPPAHPVLTPAEPTGPTDPLPKREAPRRDVPSRLVVTAGPLRGTTLPLSSSAILIGRAPSCTLVLDDDYSSQRHARVFPQEGQWFVEDLGSTNGTFIGKTRLDQPTPLPLGAQLRVGQSTLELQR